MADEELNELGKSEVGGIVIKSATLLSREGNVKPRWFANDFGSVNSMGLKH